MALASTRRYEHQSVSPLELAASDSPVAVELAVVEVRANLVFEDQG